LHDEIADDASILGMHMRPVCIKNARHFDFDAMLAVVVKKQSFRTALPFVVTRPQAHGIDMAPVGLWLRMHLRITIDFARGGLQNFGLYAFGEPEHINAAMHRRLGGLDGIKLVMHR
jgi:hypothetical protein